MMGVPNFLVMLALWGWPALAVALFSFLPPRRALAVSFVLGWLFLPQFGFPIPFVKFDKHAAVGVGALLGVILFDSQKFSTFRPSLLDLPMAVWCMVPYSAAVSNGLSPYDGLASSATQIMVWGVPYFLGRLYFSDFIGLRGLAVWMFIGGLFYVPFCLFECLISPQLHFMVYGFYQHDFNQVIRMGGYRPMVFMQHGIAVGNMMMAASLAGFWLWWTGSLRTLFKLPMWVPLGVVLGTTVAVKSTGALGLLILGIGVMFAIRMTRLWLIMIVVCGIPILYMTARSVGGWDGQNLLTLIEQTTEKERALSLQCRFDNENLLLKKAMEKPLFGWGPNGRNLVTRSDGTIESIPDGLWVIAIGADGIVGLVALYGALMVPTLMVRRRCGGNTWHSPLAAGTVIFAVLLILHAVDNLMNTMLNPIFLLGLGGVAGVGSATAARVTGLPAPRGFPVAVGQRRFA